MTDRGYFSWSQLQAYGDCPEKYRLRYVQGVPSQPSGALIAGKVGHKVIEGSEVAGNFFHPQAAEGLGTLFQEWFKLEVEEAGGADKIRWTGQARILRDEGGKPIKGDDGKPIKVKENDLWWHHEGPRMLKRYVGIRRRLAEQGFQTRMASNGRVDGIELEVAAELGGWLVKGYIDAVLVVDGDGEGAILDWKFGKSADPYQLAVYSVLLEHSRGITIRKGLIGHLRATDTDKMLSSYDLEQWIGMVEEDFVALAGGIASGVFPRKRSSFCVSCPVREHCEWGKTLNVA